MRRNNLEKKRFVIRNNINNRERGSGGRKLPKDPTHNHLIILALKKTVCETSDTEPTDKTIFLPLLMRGT